MVMIIPVRTRDLSLNFSDIFSFPKKIFRTYKETTPIQERIKMTKGGSRFANLPRGPLKLIKSVAKTTSK